MAVTNEQARVQLTERLRHLADEIVRAYGVGGTRLRPAFDEIHKLRGTVDRLSCEAEPVERVVEELAAPCNITAEPPTGWLKPGDKLQTIYYRSGQCSTNIIAADGHIKSTGDGPRWRERPANDPLLDTLEAVRHRAFQIAFWREQPPEANEATEVADDLRRLAGAIDGGQSQTDDGQTGGEAGVSDDAMLGSAALARMFNLPLPMVSKRLERWRKQNGEGWTENQERKPRDPKYLYRLGAVRPLLDRLRASGQTSGERPAK